MGRWDRRWAPRRRYNNRRYKDYDYEEPPPTPPSPHHPQSNPPLYEEGSGLPWEIEFCKSVHIPWHKVLTAKKFMYCHEGVLAWDDSAGEEAFQNAKRRYWENISGLPSETPLPDPDMYLDKLDWNPKIDSRLMADIDGIYFNPDETGHSRKSDTLAEDAPNQDPGFESPNNGSKNPWEEGSSPKVVGLNGQSSDKYNPWEPNSPALVEAAKNNIWTLHLDHEPKDNSQWTAGGWKQDGSASGWKQDGSASGWKQDGSASNWKQDRSASNWKQDGSASGWKQDGSATGGWNQGSGWKQDGLARGGWKLDGSASTWNQDGSNGEGWKQDGSARGGWNLEGSARGGWKQDGSARGGWKQDGSARGGWKQDGSSSGWKNDGLTRGWKQDASNRGWKPRNTNGHYQQNSEDNVHSWHNNFVSNTRAPGNKVWDGNQPTNNFKGSIESERAGQSSYRKREGSFSNSERYKTSRIHVDDNGAACRWQGKPPHPSDRSNA